MKTMLTSILCLLAIIAQAAAMATDPTAALSTSLASNQKELVDTLNHCRRTVKPTATNMVEAVWNDNARQTALKYAGLCKYEHSQPSERTLQSGVGCGENLFFSSYPAKWSEVIFAFNNESLFFEYGVGATKAGYEVGHYTQNVWNKSWMVGAAVAYCPNQSLKYFYVVHQCPAGNVVGSTTKPYASGTTCALCPNNCRNGLCTNPCPDNNKASNCDQYKAYCGQSNVYEACKALCTCTKGEIL